MIRGAVNEYLEAIIRLAVRGPDGVQREVEAIIDTGYDGSMTLPSSLIAELGLTWQRRGRALLADGSERVFEIYEAEVEWDDQERPVTIDAVEAMPLVGMRLLNGYELRVEVVDGGNVIISKHAA